MSRLDTMPVSPLAQQTRGCLGALVGAILTFLYLPIAFLILFSFEEAETPGLPDHRPDPALVPGDARRTPPSTRRCSTRSRSRSSWPILATIIGTMVAFPLVRGGLPFPGAHRLLFTLPIMIPGVLLGIGLLVFITALGLKLGLHTVVAGHLVFTTPFVVLIVAARLQGFDRRLEWAAADLGASLAPDAAPHRAAADRAGDPRRCPAVRHPLDRRVRGHLLHDRPAADAAAVHLHPDQVRGDARGQRAGDGDPASGRCWSSAAGHRAPEPRPPRVAVRRRRRRAR